MRSTLPALALALVVGGCYFTRSPSRPLPGLAFYRDPGVQQTCLVIFVPGFLDGPDTYRDHGFPERLVQSGARCDSVAVDLHFRYYGASDTTPIVYEDILAPAVARGYTEIWVVGISMGGLGASMLARGHGNLIDGVILLSPFLGDEGFVRSIQEAGGLDDWQPPDPMPAEMTADNYSVFLWSHLRGYVEDPENMPPLYLGWANGERLEPGARLLAEVLPEGHVISRDGGHNWATWAPLFERILARARVGRPDADYSASR